MFIVNIPEWWNTLLPLCIITDGFTNKVIINNRSELINLGKQIDEFGINSKTMTTASELEKHNLNLLYDILTDNERTMSNKYLAEKYLSMYNLVCWDIFRFFISVNFSNRYSICNFLVRRYTGDTASILSYSENILDANLVAKEIWDIYSYVYTHRLAEYEPFKQLVKNTVDWMMSKDSYFALTDLCSTDDNTKVDIEDLLEDNFTTQVLLNNWEDDFDSYISTPDYNSIILSVTNMALAKFNKKTITNSNKLSDGVVDAKPFEALINLIKNRTICMCGMINTDELSSGYEDDKSLDWGLLTSKSHIVPIHTTVKYSKLMIILSGLLGIGLAAGVGFYFGFIPAITNPYIIASIILSIFTMFIPLIVSNIIENAAFKQLKRIEFFKRSLAIQLSHYIYIAYMIKDNNGKTINCDIKMKKHEN